MTLVMASAVLREAALATNVEPDTIRSRLRQYWIAKPRQAVMFVIAHRTRWSSFQIARFMRRDDSTVRHGIRKARERIATDQEFAALVERLMAVEVVIPSFKEAA